MINLVLNWLSAQTASLRLFIGRVSTIGRLLVSLGLDRKQTRPVRLRLFFERSDGAFIKLGQILALRYDLLPIDYTNELLGLWSQVPPVPFDEIREIFITELGYTPEQYFETFNSKPIASASIAQVYRATLNNGQAVAVKIQRPGVDKTFETDFILASVLAHVLAWLGFFRSIDWPGVVAEFIAWSRQELDFTQEASNAEALRLHSQYHPRTFIPEVMTERSTKRVMISEYVDSILPIDHILKHLDQDQGYKQQLKNQFQIDLDEMGYYFVFDGMRQFIIDGFFHADPHPANVFLLSDNRLGYFDFGIIGQVGSDRQTILRLMHGIAVQDLRSVAQTLFDYVKLDLETEIKLLEHQHQTLHERYSQALAKIEEIILDDLHLELIAVTKPVYDPTVRPANFNSASVFPQVLKKAREYNVHLPSQLTTFFRTVVIADMVALKLNPDFDFLVALNRFFEVYPLGRAEELILTGQHQEAVAAKLDPASQLNFEELMELKVQEQEYATLAKERLIELVLFYAEQYDEVRQLLVKPPA